MQKGCSAPGTLAENAFVFQYSFWNLLSTNLGVASDAIKPLIYFVGNKPMLLIRHLVVTDLEEEKKSGDIPTVTSHKSAIHVLVPR